MAILKAFIDQVTFDDVWALLGESGTDLSAYRDGFSKIFEALQQAQPRENTEHMTIKFLMAEDPMEAFLSDAPDAARGERSLQVFGFIPGDDEGYAIGVKPIDTIVGLDVDPETARDYSPAVIVANCLSEITYYSTAAASIWGTRMDTYAGGLYASQACMQGDIQDVDLNALRESLGVKKKDEDLKEKYGFLF